MKPALTAEEWESLRANGAGLAGSDVWTEDGELFVGYDTGNAADVSPRPHAIAALALYQQPFGFTREMVEYLRDSFAVPGGLEPMMDEIIARIEALLPPEG